MGWETIKGFRDFVGEDALKREEILGIIRKNFRLFGFEPSETPIIEAEKFVVGNNPEDEAVRDIYRLKDRGERKLALRYEFTFQLKRIARNQKLPYKRYQIGYNFRDEPIKKGRLRQFAQCDADVVGSSIKDEAEILFMADKIFKELKIPVEIYANNRKLLNEILLSCRVPRECWQQALREIDKTGKVSKKEIADNLKKLKAEKLIDALEEKNFDKYACFREVKELINFSNRIGVKVKFKPSLVRGLSYYTGSVFEIFSKNLDVSVCGGGSYLVNNISSTGISFGLEPIFLLSPVKGRGVKVCVISIEEDDKAFSIASKIREKEIPTTVIFDKSVGKALEFANSKKIPYSVIVGGKESREGKYKLKEMSSGEEKLLTEKELISEVL